MSSGGFCAGRKTKCETFVPGHGVLESISGWERKVSKEVLFRGVTDDVPRIDKSKLWSNQPVLHDSVEPSLI